MRDFLTQISQALNNNLYYVALFPSLAIPDICGAISSDDGTANGKKYADWFDKYVESKYLGVLDGETCYYFRCSLLHQGSSQNHRSKYSRILFVEPTATNNVLHCNVLNDALNIDVRKFCCDLIDGALTWLNEVETTEQYKKNYNKFMRRYPSGLSPYLVGVPVIS